jgi:hypothetical protein
MIFIVKSNKDKYQKYKQKYFSFPWQDNNTMYWTDGWNGFDFSTGTDYCEFPTKA